MESDPYKVIILTDFDPIQSGVYSTSVGLIKNNRKFDSDFIFSFDNSNFEKEVSKLGRKAIVFTYLEHPKLSVYLKIIKPPLVHVGDWPLAYRMNELKAKKNLYSLLKCFICYLRLKKIKKIVSKFNLVFVNQVECESAKRFGYINSSHIGIGIDTPEGAFQTEFNPYRLSFSGNFDYKPNFDAAIVLIEFFRSLPNNFALNIIGFNASRLGQYTRQEKNIFLFENVDSVVKKLASLRGVYLSFLEYGSGSKNKILEALVAGCYIIGSEESFDSSLKEYKDGIFKFNIRERNWQRLVERKLMNIVDQTEFFGQKSSETRKLIINSKGWKKISEDFNTLLPSKKK